MTLPELPQEPPPEMRELMDSIQKGVAYFNEHNTLPPLQRALGAICNHPYSYLSLPIINLPLESIEEAGERIGLRMARVLGIDDSSTLNTYVRKGNQGPNSHQQGIINQRGIEDGLTKLEQEIRARGRIRQMNELLNRLEEEMGNTEKTVFPGPCIEESVGVDTGIQEYLNATGVDVSREHIKREIDRLSNADCIVKRRSSHFCFVRHGKTTYHQADYTKRLEADELQEEVFELLRTRAFSATSQERNALVERLNEIGINRVGDSQEALIKELIKKNVAIIEKVDPCKPNTIYQFCLDPANFLKGDRESFGRIFEQFEKELLKYGHDSLVRALKEQGNKERAILENAFPNALKQNVELLARLEALKDVDSVESLSNAEDYNALLKELDILYGEVMTQEEKTIARVRQRVTAAQASVDALYIANGDCQIGAEESTRARADEITQGIEGPLIVCSPALRCLAVAEAIKHRTQKLGSGVNQILEVNSLGPYHFAYFFKDAKEQREFERDFRKLSRKVLAKEELLPAESERWIEVRNRQSFLEQVLHGAEREKAKATIAILTGVIDRKCKPGEGIEVFVSAHDESMRFVLQELWSQRYPGAPLPDTRLDHMGTLNMSMVKATDGSINITVEQPQAYPVQKLEEAEVEEMLSDAVDVSHQIHVVDHKGNILVHKTNSQEVYEPISKETLAQALKGESLHAEKIPFANRDSAKEGKDTRNSMIRLNKNQTKLLQTFCNDNYAIRRLNIHNIIGESKPSWKCANKIHHQTTSILCSEFCLHSKT